MAGVHRTQAHHLWSDPGYAATDPELNPAPFVTFDASALDLVSLLLDATAEQIVNFELPHLCDARPHEDPHVEAWLQKWADGEGHEESDPPLALSCRCLPALVALVDERPEVCPLFRRLLGRFEVALASWLTLWPVTEPWREGLPWNATRDPSLGGITAPELEQQLHAVLSLIQAPGWLQFSPERLTKDVCEHFRQVAFGWVMKLDSVYGLPVFAQPDRAADPDLSLLFWDAEAFGELLRCAFFRPAELHIWRLAQRWLQENGIGIPGDAAAPSEAQAAIARWASPECESGGGALLLELLPADAVEEVREVTGGMLQDQPSRGPTPVDCEVADGGGTPGSAASFSPANAAPVGEPEDEALAAEMSRPPATRISGGSFRRVLRRADCPTVAYEDASSLHLEQRAGSDGCRCWNAAAESVVVGGSRQMIASAVPMASIRGARFRLDFRVIAGVDTEAAHLFEVGIAAEPAAGVLFKVSGPGADRPAHPLEGPDCPAPFASFVPALEAMVEGVRLVVEVDFDAQCATARNLPQPAGVAQPQRALLGAWLAGRSRASARRARPPGELEDLLFRAQAEYLHDRIEQGLVEDHLSGAVLDDGGAALLRDEAALQEVVRGGVQEGQSRGLGKLPEGAAAPAKPEEYHFYLVLPAGMEVEIY